MTAKAAAAAQGWPTDACDLSRRYNANHRLPANQIASEEAIGAVMHGNGPADWRKVLWFGFVFDITPSVVQQLVLWKRDALEMLLLCPNDSSSPTLLRTPYPLFKGACSFNEEDGSRPSSHSLLELSKITGRRPS